jgi:hydroxymethylpyrimidine pyrophosphatase-like HAD family hydrolase
MFVSDLDGTLLTSDKTIPKSCIDTINKVQQNGDIFVIASGRS